MCSSRSSRECIYSGCSRRCLATTTRDPSRVRRDSPLLCSRCSSLLSLLLPLTLYCRFAWDRLMRLMLTGRLVIWDGLAWESPKGFYWGVLERRFLAFCKFNSSFYIVERLLNLIIAKFTKILNYVNICNNF